MRVMTISMGLSLGMLMVDLSNGSYERLLQGLTQIVIELSNETRSSRTWVLTLAGRRNVYNLRYLINPCWAYLEPEPM